MWSSCKAVVLQRNSAPDASFFLVHVKDCAPQTRSALCLPISPKKWKLYRTRLSPACHPLTSAPKKHVNSRVKISNRLARHYWWLMMLIRSTDDRWQQQDEFLRAQMDFCLAVYKASTSCLIGQTFPPSDTHCPLRCCKQSNKKTTHPNNTASLFLFLKTCVNLFYLHLKYQLWICWYIIKKNVCGCKWCIIKAQTVIECSQIQSPKIVLAYVYVIPVTRFSKETSFWGWGWTWFIEIQNLNKSDLAIRPG